MDKTSLTPAQLQDIADRIFSPWVRSLGMRVCSAEPDAVVLQLPQADSLSHRDDLICGQALLAAADSAMVLAVANHHGEFLPVATTDLHMQFMRAAQGPLRIRSVVTRMGRSVVFASVHFYLKGEASAEVGRASGTFSVPLTAATRKQAS